MRDDLKGGSNKKRNLKQVKFMEQFCNLKISIMSCHGLINTLPISLTFSFSNKSATTYVSKDFYYWTSHLICLSQDMNCSLMIAERQAGERWIFTSSLICNGRQVAFVFRSLFCFVLKQKMVRKVEHDFRIYYIEMIAEKDEWLTMRSGNGNGMHALRLMMSLERMGLAIYFISCIWQLKINFMRSFSQSINPSLTFNGTQTPFFMFTKHELAHSEMSPQ